MSLIENLGLDDVPSMCDLRMELQEPFYVFFDLKHVYHCLKNTKQRQIRSCSPTTTRFLNLKLNSSLTFLGLPQIST